MSTTRKLAEFATAWTIPTHVAKQDRPVRIGPCVYSRYQGIYAYKVYGEMNAIGLRRDGTWHKYGQPFDTPEDAYRTLLATTCERWGDTPGINEPLPYSGPVYRKEGNWT